MLYYKSRFLPSHFSNFFFATFWYFVNWPPMSCSILLFLWNTTIGLLSNTLRNSGLICSMCQIFLTIYDMFGSVQLYVNTSGMLFLLLIFSLFCKSSFCSVKSYSNCLHYISIPKDIIGEVNCKICVGSSFSQISFINPFSLTDFIEKFFSFFEFLSTGFNILYIFYM